MGNEPLKNNIVWITGAGRGIGRAMAHAFGCERARVVVSARTEIEIAQVALEVRERGGSALPIRCDVTQPRAIASLVRRVGDEWGEIDILINNAGCWIFNEIEEVTAREWDLHIATNLTAAYLCTKAVLASMKARRSGHIVNIVSVAGEKPFKNCTAYCASKYGLLGFTEALRLDVRNYGIRVTAMLPGATDTAGWNGSNADRTRMLRPESVASAVVALCKTAGAMPEKLIIRPQGGDL